MRWWPFRRYTREVIQNDIRDELASHVELRIEDNLKRGLSPADAGREAAKRFGPVAGVAVDCEKIQRRRESRARSLWLDLRASWLGWRRAPLVSVLGAVVGAIGISTALVTALIADGAFLRQPPGMQVDDRVFIVTTSGDGDHAQNMSYELARRLAAAAPEHPFFVWADEDFQLSAGARSGVWPGVYAGGEYFSVLGVRAAAGRLFERLDEVERRPVIVLSGALARDLFGSIAAAPGQTLRVNGRPMRVIGVTADGFRGGISTRRADIWLPVTVEALLAVPRVFPNGLRVQGLVDTPSIGWLLGGVQLTSVDAQDSVRARYTAVIRSVPRTGEAAQGEERRAALFFARPWLTPFSHERNQLATVMKPVGIAVALTMLLAASCMSSLLVGRLVHRQQEVAIRLSLGASRWRVLRLVVAEHAISVAAAATLAVPLTLTMLAVISQLRVASEVRIDNLSMAIDGRAVAVLLLLAAILGVASILGPLGFARATTRTVRINSTRVVSSGAGLRRVLMAAQVATGCALLAASGLLTRTIDRLLAQPRGFDAAQVAFVEIDLEKAGLDDESRADVLRKLRARAGAASAPIAVTTGRPYPGLAYDWVFTKVLDAPPEVRPVVTMLSRIEGPYFEALGIPILAGRTFTANAGARREVIVSRPFADYYWPGQNAIGRTILVGAKNEPYAVIGVAGATHDLTLRAPASRIYLPLGDVSDRLLVVARRAQPRMAAESELPPLVSQIDARLAATQRGVLEDLAQATIAQRRAIRSMTAVVGAGSLLMVVAGVWGLAHTSVSRRWREFGLRLALGAERRSIGRLALKDAVIVATAGVAAGIVAAWQFGRVLSSFLFGVEPSDPIVIGAAAIMLIAAVFAGAWPPARRASRADPSQLLRTL